MVGPCPRRTAAWGYGARHPACCPVEQGKFMYAIREWSTVCRSRAHSRGTTCLMHGLDLFAYLAGVCTASTAGLAVPHPPRPRLIPGIAEVEAFAGQLPRAVRIGRPSVAAGLEEDQPGTVGGDQVCGPFEPVGGGARPIKMITTFTLSPSKLACHDQG